MKAETQHDLLKAKLLECFARAPLHWQTQVELLATCYGYRTVGGKLLRFSVSERELIQSSKDDEAASLLQKITSEAEEQFKKWSDSQESRQKKQKSAVVERITKRNRLQLRKPPQEIVLTPEKRVRITKNPYSPFSAYTALNQQMLFGPISKMIALAEQSSPLSRSLQYIERTSRFHDKVSGLGRLRMPSIFLPLIESSEEDNYEYIPEERVTSLYHAAELNLNRKLKEYPRIVWSRLPTEQAFQEDTFIMSLITRHRQAIKRALDELQRESQIVQQGTRTSASYCLTSYASL